MNKNTPFSEKKHPKAPFWTAKDPFAAFLRANAERAEEEAIDYEAEFAHPDYGLSPAHPIPVNGIPAGYQFLKRLRSPYGTPFEPEWRESMPGRFGHFIDCHTGHVRNREEEWISVKIYLDCYCVPPRLVPMRGWTLSEPMG